MQSVYLSLIDLGYLPEVPVLLESTVCPVTSLCLLPPMLWLAIALLIGEYCLALIVKVLFGLKFEPLVVPLVTLIVGFAAFFLFAVYLVLLVALH